MGKLTEKQNEEFNIEEEVIEMKKTYLLDALQKNIRATENLTKLKLIIILERGWLMTARPLKFVKDPSLGRKNASKERKSRVHKIAICEERFPAARCDQKFSLGLRMRGQQEVKRRVET